MYCLTRECYKPPPASLPTFINVGILSHVYAYPRHVHKSCFIRHSVALMELTIILAYQILFLLTSLFFYLMFLPGSYFYSQPQYL